MINFSSEFGIWSFVSQAEFNRLLLVTLHKRVTAGEF